MKCRAFCLVIQVIFITSLYISLKAANQIPTKYPPAMANLVLWMEPWEPHSSRKTLSWGEPVRAATVSFLQQGFFPSPPPTPQGLGWQHPVGVWGSALRGEQDNSLRVNRCPFLPSAWTLSLAVRFLWFASVVSWVCLSIPQQCVLSCIQSCF